jgi:hypothetical protein
MTCLTLAYQARIGNHKSASSDKAKHGGASRQFYAKDNLMPNTGHPVMAATPILVYGMLR